MKFWTFHSDKIEHSTYKIGDSFSRNRWETVRFACERIYDFTEILFRKVAAIRITKQVLSIPTIRSCLLSLFLSLSSSSTMLSSIYPRITRLSSDFHLWFISQITNLEIFQGIYIYIYTLADSFAKLFFSTLESRFYSWTILKESLFLYRSITRIIVDKQKNINQKMLLH